MESVVRSYCLTCWITTAFTVTSRLMTMMSSPCLPMTLSTFPSILCNLCLPIFFLYFISNINISILVCNKIITIVYLTLVFTLGIVIVLSRNKCNVGYGFVNMTSPEATLRLYNSFHHQNWEVFNSRKICQVTYARLQVNSLHVCIYVFECVWT